MQMEVVVAAVAVVVEMQVQHPPPGSGTQSPTPRTLSQLWDEFMVGIGGEKPACLSTKRRKRGM